MCGTTRRISPRNRTECLTPTNRIAKTVSIEVGMQNSGLAVALAMKYFTPLSALPGALLAFVEYLRGYPSRLLGKTKIISLRGFSS